MGRVGVGGPLIDVDVDSAAQWTAQTLTRGTKGEPTEPQVVIGHYCREG